MSDRDCKHGHLARSCEICELDKRLEEIKAKLTQTEEYCNALWVLCRDFIPVFGAGKDMFDKAVEKGKAVRNEKMKRLEELESKYAEACEIVEEAYKLFYREFNFGIESESQEQIDYARNWLNRAEAHRKGGKDE